MNKLELTIETGRIYDGLQVIICKEAKRDDSTIFRTTYIFNCEDKSRNMKFNTSVSDLFDNMTESEFAQQIQTNYDSSNYKDGHIIH